MSRTSNEERQQIRDKHAAAIGKIVIAWNDYHELLGEIFASLFGVRGWSLALSAWHVIENDRAQRSMLVAVANRKLKQTDRAYREIVWMIEKTNQMISDQRNSGIHTPLIMFTNSDGISQMLPHAMFGNRRAGKLYGAVVLAEFEHYERQIREMIGYAVAIRFATSPKKRRRGRVTWPQRPQLLPRAPQVNPKA